MLSNGAFNALLKTLEEPPSHILFILATTELNKIPATILSRCKRFDFHRISPEDMLPRLRYISDEEKIGITDDALRLIAFLATGAMRDALSMLELFVGKTGIDREKASEALGVVGNAPILALLEAVAAGDTARALSLLEELYTASKDMGVLCSELAEMFRHLLVVKYASDSASKLVDAEPDVIAALRNCEDSFTKERLLYSLEITEQTQNKLARSGLSRRTLAELMLMRLCDARLSNSPEAVLARLSDMEAKLASGSFSAPEAAQKHTSAPPPRADSAPVQGEEIPLPEAPPEAFDEFDAPPATSERHAPQKRVSPAKPDEPPVPPAPPQEEKGTEMLAFAELLEEIKAQDMVTYSMLSGAYAEQFPDKIKIYVNSMGYFMLTTDKPKNEMIASLASKLLGMPVRVEYARTTGNAVDKPVDLSAF